MVHLVTELSKYTMLILFALYTYQGFSALKRNCTKKKQNRKFRRQVFYLYLIHLNAYGVLYFSTENPQLLLFYGAQVIFFTVILILYRTVYEKASRLLVNNMCMLMMLGFVTLTRLSYDSAIRQFQLAIVSVALTMLIPLLISRLKFFRDLTWLYAITGIGMLGIVAVMGAVTKGAKLSFTVAGITIQPSEFIKILFVFLVAAMLYESAEWKQVVKVTFMAAMHVLILVLSKDLGGALIFFVAYLIMLYVATQKPLYFFGGLAGGAVASVVAYFLFAHVRVRVLAWKEPLAHYELEGNQISNSLFAIGTGGWFGMGLNQGMPNRIPEVRKDFIFSAIAEEFGGLFALCLILVCLCCFLMFLNIAMQMKDRFYKYVALGLGTIYGFQVFLSVGGNIKFIPSTGVTLPLVSYGGSSLLSSLMIFAIIQGLYLLRHREGGEHDGQTRAIPKEKEHGKESARSGGRSGKGGGEAGKEKPGSGKGEGAKGGKERSGGSAGGQRSVGREKSGSGAGGQRKPKTEGDFRVFDID